MQAEEKTVIQQPFHVILLGMKKAGRHSLRQRICHNEYLTSEEVYAGSKFPNLMYHGDYQESLDPNPFETSETTQIKTWWWTPLVPTQHMNFNCALVLVDATNRESLDEAKMHLNSLRTGDYMAPLECTFAIAVTKTDATDRQVPKEEISQIAVEYGALVFEVSALTGAGIDHLKRELIEKMIQNPVTKTARNSSGGTCSFL
jgi:GTPase SAR1 family protein